jgi:hypothetical protein
MDAGKPGRTNPANGCLGLRPARRNAAMPAGRDRALAAVTARRRQCALPPARKRAARGVPPWGTRRLGMAVNQPTENPGRVTDRGLLCWAVLGERGGPAQQN